jgi:drug/metabolite transporter (DMT)-like permease
MKPIWYFVGLVLLVIGVIIIISGIYSIINPPEQMTVLGEHNPDIWWGILMAAVGVIYLISNKGKRI